MDKNIKEKWVNELRSGKYKQAYKTLRINFPNGEYRHCCLGVLMELTLEQETFFNYAALSNIVNGNGGGDGVMSILIEMNDNQKRSFSYIADWIDKNL